MGRYLIMISTQKNSSVFSSFPSAICDNDYDKSDGGSEAEEDGGKGEAKELTLLQIMERR